MLGCLLEMVVFNFVIISILSFLVKFTILLPNFVIRAYLEFVYFAKTENVFLKVLEIKVGLAQQNLGPKTKILYGAFLYVNIN